MYQSFQFFPKFWSRASSCTVSEVEEFFNTVLLWLAKLFRLFLDSVRTVVVMGFVLLAFVGIGTFFFKFRLEIIIRVFLLLLLFCLRLILLLLFLLPTLTIILLLFPILLTLLFIPILIPPHPRQGKSNDEGEETPNQEIMH